MKKLSFIGSACAAALLCMGANTHAQSFQKSFYETGTDMNHYSIETAPNGDYVLAGTLFRGGNQDIQVMRLDPAGNLLWTVNLDETDDDRALDLVVDPNGEIVVVGYVSPDVDWDVDFYAVKLDPSGGFIGDLQIDGFHTAAGTNIIYSQATGNYIVGGYMGEPLAVPMLGSVARILELDGGLGIVNNYEVSTFHMKHANINDIVEVPTGYFITGSMANTASSPSGGEGVLAVFLDHGFNITADLSFESTNSEHVGVSAVYDAATDEVWLMSNNSLIHSPQITQIVDVSGAPGIGTEYYLELDPTYGTLNAAGFKLELSPYNSRSLVAAGLYRTNSDNAGNTNSATPWIAEFDRSTGVKFGAYIWPAPSPNFHSHGGGVFSTFSGEHPYFFNQELMIPRPDGRGFTVVGPIEIGGDYGIDVFTSLNLSSGDIPPCFEVLDYEPIEIDQDYNPITDVPQSVLDWMPNYPIPFFSMDEEVYCDELYDYRAANSNEESGTIAPSSLQLGETTVNVSPNPVTNEAFIEIYGDDLSGHQFTVRNSLGQVVYTSVQLEGNYFSDRVAFNGVPAGVYFLTLVDNINGTMEVTKLIKQ